MVSKSKVKKHNVQALKAQIIPEKRLIDSAGAEDIDDEELLLTTETLEALAQNPALLRHKRIKPLKAAIHAFIRATGTSTTGSLTNRISDALTDARWLDARVLLSEFRIRGEEVKLGTLQRWVREVDAAAAAALGAAISTEVFLTLDAILRATAVKHYPTPWSTSPHDPALIDTKSDRTLLSTGDGLLEADVSGVIQFAPTVTFSKASGISLYSQVQDGTIFSDRSSESWRENAKIIEVTPAAERKPPNQYDATIYTTLQPLVSQASLEKTKRHDIPAVPGAFIIEDMLSVEECKSIIRQGESVTFSPDCAVAGSATQQASILAHNFYYFADENTLSEIYRRAQPFLPQEIEGCRLTGINARFRVYRYVPGAVYRPHIDGSWPRSGLDLTKPEGKQYMYDDKRDGAQLSRLTFLIYLNDDFEEGYTTFFIPQEKDGKLLGVQVEPRIGSVLVFPHGDSVGALLHEGSAVKSGAKYVIRTDVLYERSNVKK